MQNQGRTRLGSTTALLRSAHVGPALAVTAVAALLATSAHLSPGRALLAVAAVLTGQVSIGWSNDLLDADRDRRVHRPDKPVATGEIAAATVRAWCVAALVATLGLSLACGLGAGLVNLVCVAAGWAYNLGLKSSVWSWLPYAVAFGGLPVFVSLAAGPPQPPPAVWPVCGALLGVGAHLVNALPDLADDAATGVHGLPHRLGARRLAPVATVVLVSASVVVASVQREVHPLAAWLGLAVVGTLAAVALLGRGRTPFRAAVAIAVVDVALLAGAR